MSGRFAPTPSSDLHIGNLRTALVAWLAARSTGRDFLLRIEDLDLTRLPDAAEFADRQLRDLARLGLTHDGPVVRQSERFPLYAEALEHLEVYECFCSRKEVAEAAQAPHGSTPFYPGTCRDLTPEERDERRLVRQPCLRVKTHQAEVTFHDLLHGDVTGPTDDFVVRRADGTYSYNLAVVVDDGLQGIDQVVRGDDLLDSTPRQAWLAEALGFGLPAYLHVPLVYSVDGTRLAKRDQAMSLTRLLDSGLTVADVIDRLAVSLGLATRGEHVTLDHLVDRFDPARLPTDPWYVEF